MKYVDPFGTTSRSSNNDPLKDTVFENWQGNYTEDDSPDDPFKGTVFDNWQDDYTDNDTNTDDNYYEDDNSNDNYTDSWLHNIDIDNNNSSSPNPTPPDNSSITNDSNPITKNDIQNSIDAKDYDKAIGQALIYFDIDISKLNSIKYDSTIPKDGAATTSSIGDVNIGKNSFKSVSYLGSTLGHEIEVHYDQQALKNAWYVGEIGTAIQEVQAYDYEIANATRFGTSSDELEEYTRLREYYYNVLTDEYKKRVGEGNYLLKEGDEEK